MTIYPWFLYRDPWGFFHIGLNNLVFKYCRNWFVFTFYLPSSMFLFEFLKQAEDFLCF